MALLFARSMALLQRGSVAVVPAAPRPFLNLREASLYSGLSLKLLERLVGQKRLKSFQDGCVKVSRADLDRLNVAKLIQATAQLRAGLARRKTR